MKLVLDASKTQGSMSGQEERDNLFARLFGITSIIQSGLIARNDTLPTSSTSSSSPESYELVVTTLIALGEKKSWLRESAWWALVSAVETLAKSDVEWKEQGVEATFDAIYGISSGWTPEKLALTLRLQTLFPKKDWSLATSPVFKSTEILATQNLKVVANILKVCSFIHPLESCSRSNFLQESRASEEDAESSAAPGGWKPQLHFTWSILLDLLFPQGENASPQGSFQDFWSLVVDGKLPFSRDILLVSPVCPRIPLLVDFISGEKVLGIPVVPKGLTQDSKLPRSTFSFHQEFHAILDKPSLKKRSVLA